MLSRTFSKFPNSLKWSFCHYKERFAENFEGFPRILSFGNILKLSLEFQLNKKKIREFPTSFKNQPFLEFTVTLVGILNV